MAHHTDDQHPINEETGEYRAHCVECGSYIADTVDEPPVDFLCEKCEFGEEESYL